MEPKAGMRIENKSMKQHFLEKKNMTYMCLSYNKSGISKYKRNDKILNIEH